MGIQTLEQVILRPIITEKSTNLSTNFRKYTFAVADWASKNHIREAFAKLFPDLKVVKVNTSKIFAHARRTAKGRTNPVDHKKAIVTVENGSIDYFPEV